MGSEDDHINALRLGQSRDCSSGVAADQPMFTANLWITGNDVLKHLLQFFSSRLHHSIVHLATAVAIAKAESPVWEKSVGKRIFLTFMDDSDCVRDYRLD